MKNAKLIFALTAVAFASGCATLSPNYDRGYGYGAGQPRYAGQQ